MQRQVHRLTGMPERAPEPLNTALEAAREGKRLEVLRREGRELRGQGGRTRTLVHDRTVMRFMLLVVCLSGAGLAQNPDGPSLLRFLEPGATLDRSLDLILDTASPDRSALESSTLPATLTPVVSGQGRPATATLSPLPAPQWLITDQGTRTRVPLTFATDAPSGVYTLNVSLPSGLQVNTPPIAYNASVRAAPPLRPGAVFLNLSGGPYSLNGRPLAFREVINRLFTLRALTPGRADFTVEGLTGTVRWAGAAGSFPDLVPVVDDPGLTRYQRQFEHHPAWLYGGLDALCPLSGTTQLRLRAGPRVPVRITRVLRLAQPLWSGAQQDSGQQASWDVIALTPIAVQLDRPAEAEVLAGMGEAADGDPESLLDALTAPQNATACPTLTVILADTWSLPRTLSAAPPSSRVPGDVPDDPRGLDRWQYAWLFGFPSATFGARDDLLKLDQWQYVNIPFASTVRFDKQGKVRAVDVPSLP